MTDREALLAIQSAMSGEEWSPDTLDEIADIMNDAGYPIDDPHEEEEEE